MGQLIGATIQLPIARPLPFKHQRYSLWCALDLGFEQAVEALIGKKCRGCLVPLPNQLRTLCWIRKPELRYSPVRIRYYFFQHTLKTVKQTSSGRLVK